MNVAHNKTNIKTKKRVDYEKPYQKGGALHPCNALCY